MTLLVISSAAFFATLLGGALALRIRDKLHLVLGFSAGAVAGLAFFDLLPEAFTLAGSTHDANTIAFFAAMGFFGYLILDRLILLHSHEHEGHAHTARGSFGALTLSAHSFFDGIAIGIGFQVSPVLGFVVTAAVLAHDFSDGINTVNLLLKSGGSRAKAYRWLLIDALAPALGVATTLFITLPSSYVGLILAAFVGSFLYLSASDLIPESHHQHPHALTTMMTIVGAVFMYLIVQIAG